jgi:hypothetical protein
LTLKGEADHFKFNDLSGNRTRYLPSCSIVPEPTTLPRAPIHVIVWNISKYTMKSISKYNMKSIVVVYVKTCNVVKVYWCFGGMCSLFLQVRRISPAIFLKQRASRLSLVYFSTVKIEAVHSCKISVHLYQTTRRYTPEVVAPHIHDGGNLTSMLIL